MITCRSQKMESFINLLFNYFNRQMMAGSVESAEKSTTRPAHCLSLCHLFSTSPSVKMVSPKHFLEFKFPINKCLYWFILITNCYILCFDNYHRSYAPTESRWFKKYFVCLYRKGNNSGMNHSDDAVILIHGGLTLLNFMGTPCPLNKLWNTSLSMKENESAKFSFPQTGWKSWKSTKP